MKWPKYYPNSMEKDMAQKSSENYKTATIITAEYHLGYYREIIAIEKRKSSKLGCELFTEISGEKYRIYSGLFRGCLKLLVMKLPPNAMLSIVHSLPVESGKGVIWINVKENILFCVDAMDASRESVYLVSNLNGNNFQTNVYDIDDTLDALKELKDNFNANGVKIIKVCPFCAFINYYSNTSVCLRDLGTREIRDTQERILDRKDFYEYYEKIAWDIEEFHFCSAFISNE